eukprot:gene1504-biopygen2853
MQVFGAASGQHLQPAKCSLLPVGAVPPAMSALPQQSGLRITTHARSLGVDFDSTGVWGLDWQQRMQQVRQRLQKITRIPHLSAFGRAFAVNAYALSTLLYGAQYACAIPTEHALLLMKWSAAVVDAGLGPDDDLRRPPGIPTACMAAHPRQGGFGLLPLREHMFSRWACVAARLLVGADATPWIAIGRALLTRLLGPVPGGGVWSLALCDRGHLFSGTAVLPLVNPLRALAVGLRALPPLQYVGDEDALPPGSWCWHAPLWSNPFLVRTQTWQWFGKQREVVVGLECEAPAGLLHLPALQTVGQAVCLLIKLQLIDQLPAVAVYNAAQAAGSHPPACTVDSIADARQHLSAHLGWTLGSEKVLLADLSVALATRLQTLESHVAIRARHDQYVTQPLDAAGLHTLVWDMVCLAALHALDRGRCTAWAAAPSLATPVLVEQVAARAAVAAFWSALADFAATVVVPKRAAATWQQQQQLVLKPCQEGQAGTFVLFFKEDTAKETPHEAFSFGRPLTAQTFQRQLHKRLEDVKRLISSVDFGTVTGWYLLQEPSSAEDEVVCVAGVAADGRTSGAAAAGGGATGLPAADAAAEAAAAVIGVGTVSQTVETQEGDLGAQAAVQPAASTDQGTADGSVEGATGATPGLQESSTCGCAAGALCNMPGQKATNNHKCPDCATNIHAICGTPAPGFAKGIGCPHLCPACETAR